MLAVVVLLLAGAAGALVRFGVSRALPVAAHPVSLPRAVFIVNVVGSFIAGLALGLAQTHVISTEVGFIVISGICGGLTTFSTFAVETIELMMQGRVRVAMRSLALNLILGTGAAFLGYLPTLAFGR